MSTCHGESPLVLDLLAHIEIQLGDQQTISSSTQRRSPAAIRSSYIGASVEMSEISVSLLTIAAREFVRENFSSNSVDTNSEIMVSNGSISGLDTPEWFRKTINSS
jgi:hypothetical protein